MALLVLLGRDGNTGPVGVGHCRWLEAGEHVEDSAGRVGEGGGGGTPGQPHHVRGEHRVGMVEKRVVHGWFGFEDIEPHTG